MRLLKNRDLNKNNRRPKQLKLKNKSKMSKLKPID